jgi:hypothetical protein
MHEQEAVKERETNQRPAEQNLNMELRFGG